MKNIKIIAACCLICASAAARQNGAITPDLLGKLRENNSLTAQDKAIRNALNTTSIAALALNSESLANVDTHFSDEVKTKGITDQQRSGRCWLFTGLNVLRAQMISQYNLGEFQFSQNYCFFYDQLEKSNLFLQGIIDTRQQPLDDRKVDWLMKHPLSDGGTFTGVSNLVMKYGLVPSEVMPETLVANNTSAFASRLSELLRQDALKLRAAKSGKEAVKLKEQMLGEIYHVLCLCFGEPPVEFEWTMYDAAGNKVSTKTYTPKSFYQEYLGQDLEHSYVMLMNDPSRPYNQVYEIDYDRHVYEGDNWLYLNLPVERIKEMAIASIKAGKAMYFSCDVNKFLNRNNGTLDLNNYDYESLLGVDYTMDKKERILTYTSGSSHAMTLVAVDLNTEGRSVKWMVENSWGRTGFNGKLIMTDEWFDEYMFRLVVEEQFVPEDLKAMLKQTPVRLPAWDPMFSGEE